MRAEDNKPQFRLGLEQGVRNMPAKLEIFGACQSEYEILIRYYGYDTVFVPGVASYIRVWKLEVDTNSKFTKALWLVLPFLKKTKRVTPDMDNLERDLEVMGLEKKSG